MMRWTKSKKLSHNIEITLTYMLLIIGSVVILFPLFWMLSTSLKAQMDVFIYPPKWIPNPLHWENYVNLITIWPFFKYAGNSLLVTGGNIVGKIIASSLAAYGFARLRAPGKNIIFIIYLSTMMLPEQVTLIPQFVLFNKIGWTNSFKPLIVPGFFLGPFYTFLLRQFFMTIPDELEDAARIDGCNTFQILYRMILPLSGPALAIVAIFEFRNKWNDFLSPLIYLNSPAKYTLALGLQFFQGSDSSMPQLHLLMAASFLSMLPVVLLFIVAQKWFIQGIVFTGIKG